MIPYERKIRAWLKLQGFSLKLRRGMKWRLNWWPNTVTGDPKRELQRDIDPEEALAMLLHECGHVRRFRQGTMRDITVPKSFSKKNKSASRWYYNILHEEMDAWEEAKIVAKEIGIPPIDDILERMKFDCLDTYTKWCFERGPLWFDTTTEKKEK